MFDMTRHAKSTLRSAAVGLVTGGLTFLAVNKLTCDHKVKRKTAAKAFKVLGNFMDSV